MAKNDSYSQIISEFNNGIDIDTDPSQQKKGSRRYTLNTVELSSDRLTNLSNEPSNVSVDKFPAGFIPCGDKYMSDGEVAVILVNPQTGYQEIGIIGKDDKYTTHVHTSVLGIPITHQCDIKFRIRRGNTRVIYWTNGFNNARTYNFDKPYDFYTSQYLAYIRSGNPTPFPGEKWDISSFELIKTYETIPSFSNVEVLEYGAILPGSYNFAIQYVDEDLNPTEWITTTNTVNIYNDSLDGIYEKIRGSRNTDNSVQSFQRANKSIKLTITNLDPNYPFYRIAIIRAAGNNGEPDKVLAADIQSTTNSIFIYSGNDTNLTETALEDILIDKEVIYAPKHLEQQENILLVFNGRGKNVPWCDFQQYASSIHSKFVAKEVILNSVFSDPNVKAAKSTFMFRGYMPGEVYSFGIVYIFKDGYVSPVFHIPGVNKTQIVDPSDPMKMTNTGMLYHELPNNYYIDRHTCTGGDYWSDDATGAGLRATPIRHHRFPFRKDAVDPKDPTVTGLPLVTRATGTTTINKYKLTVRFELNPLYTPTPGWPTGTTTINYTINYKPTGSGTTFNFKGSIQEADAGKTTGAGTNLIVYDDTITLDDMTASVPNPSSSLPYKGKLDPACDLALYKSGSTYLFNYYITYTPYPATRLQDVDKSKIFGIEFSQIRVPHPDVVGFYIVRNEREDEDRLIIDNGVFGAMTTYSDFRSIGLLMPRQFYPINNCGHGTMNSSKPLEFYNKSMWFFNPEYEYFQKKTEFGEVVVEGTYNQSGAVNMPTISNASDNDPATGQGLCNYGGTKGVYIQDVQAGTSYNPDINKKKDKDDDGFDLVIGYRNTNVAFSQEPSTGSTGATNFPSQDKSIYLSAAAYQNYLGSTFYNVSVDNKMGIYIADNNFNTDLIHDTGANSSRLIYGALTRNITTSYSNFMNRPYYKEHNNAIYFGGSNTVSGLEIYNGDAQISATSLVSTVFYDMVVGEFAKKTKVWKIVIGAVVVIVGVILAIPSVGTSLGLTAAAVAALGALAPLAISIGVSMITSGIKFEQMKAMIETDYEKGLRETVVDGGVFECVNKDLVGAPNANAHGHDDTIRWFSDMISGVYIESAVPFGLRTGLTVGVPDFMDAPAKWDEPMFRSYVTEKLTTIDRDQGSGRLYRGFASSEIYDMNLDYMRFNHEKVFIHLPIEYDCCSLTEDVFPRRAWWSEQSFQEEKIDNYRSFLPNNYADIEGEHGEITGVYRLGNSLFIQSKEGTWQLIRNKQERVTGSVVSFIGTGNLFDILPNKIVDDDLGAVGTLHKWANLKTRMGVFTISEPENKIYLHTDRVEDITESGIRSFAIENIRDFLSTQMYSIFGVPFLHTNNPANPHGTGYISIFDSKYNRVIFTKKDYLLLPGQVNALQIVPVKPSATATDFVYCTEDGIFYHGAIPIPLSDKSFFEDKSFTISFSLNTRKWVSWHSYLPNYYIHSKDRMYSYTVGSDDLWRHNMDGSYHVFNGVHYPHIIEGVLTAEDLVDKTFEDIYIQTKAMHYIPFNKQFVDSRYITFNKIIVYNHSQCSGELFMQVKQTNVNKQQWFAQQTQRVLGGLLIDRQESTWTLNKLRNFVVDYNTPFFTSDWDNIKNQYPIDKVVTPTVIDFRKDWRTLETFKGRYIIFRLKLDNFDNVNLITNFLVSTIQSTD